MFLSFVLSIIALDKFLFIKELSVKYWDAGDGVTNNGL